MNGLECEPCDIEPSKIVNGQKIPLTCKCSNILIVDVADPKIKTMTELRKSRIQQKADENAVFKGKEKMLKEFDAKIEEKENCIYRKNYVKHKRYTRSKMIKDRNDRENSYNAEHFQMKLTGIHNEEPPKFYKTNKEWWKIRDGYVEQPKNVSHHLLQQENKFWSRNDMVLLADFSTEEAPQQPFKDFKQSQRKKEKITEKPNNYKDFKMTKNVKKSKGDNTRWSAKQGYFTQYEGRLFDKVKQAATSKADYEPLYSSFNKGGVFVPPATSKDALKLQKQEDVKITKTKKVSISGKNSHRLSMMVSEAHNPRESLVGNEQNMFKRVQSSYGHRNKSTLSKDNREPITDYDSTKVSTQKQSKRCLSIRSGAFRI